MRPFVILFPLMALMACEDLEVANDPDALADLRGNRSCVRAVNNETGVTGATPNTELAVVEVNQFIINGGDGSVWTCFTNDAQVAQALVMISGAGG